MTMEKKYGYLFQFHCLSATAAAAAKGFITINWTIQTFSLFSWKICDILKLLYFLNAVFFSFSFSFSIHLIARWWRQRWMLMVFVWFDFSLHFHSIRKRKIESSHRFCIAFFFLLCIKLRLFYQMAKILTQVNDWTEMVQNVIFFCISKNEILWSGLRCGQVHSIRFGLDLRSLTQKKIVP